MKTYQEIRLEKIKEILWDVDYTDDNIWYICKYWKLENIIELKWEDYTNDNIKDICIYWEIELIRERKDLLNNQEKIKRKPKFNIWDIVEIIDEDFLKWANRQKIITSIERIDIVEHSDWLKIYYTLVWVGESYFEEDIALYNNKE